MAAIPTPHDEANTGGGRAAKSPACQGVGGARRNDEGLQKGGIPTFIDALVNGEVAPRRVIRVAAIGPPASTQTAIPRAGDDKVRLARETLRSALSRPATPTPQTQFGEASDVPLDGRAGVAPHHDGSLGPSRIHSGQQSQPDFARRERRPSHR
jgi:hypothetical protein